MEKTIKTSVIGLTNRKKEWLDIDYNNYQWWMIFGIDHGLLSAFKAAKGFKQKVIKYKTYPLLLQSRFIKEWFRTRETKLTKHWIKIPNSQRKGQGIWLPLHFHQPLPKKYTLKDSYLVRKQDKYYIHFCMEIPEPQLYEPKTIFGIDLGLKNPITMVDLRSKTTQFLGKQLKQVKGKYYYLRKQLGQQKHFKMIKKIRDKEQRKVNTLLHQLSKSIVMEAKKKKAAIVIGKLKDLKKNKGRKFNRKLSGFSHYKFTQFLTYKAKERGVPLITVNEAYTSKTCSVCGTLGTRTKNWFVCTCGYQDNADRNAAFNIGKRGLSYMLGSGAVASAQKSSTLRIKPDEQMRGQVQESLLVT